MSSTETWAFLSRLSHVWCYKEVGRSNWKWGQSSKSRPVTSSINWYESSNTDLFDKVQSVSLTFQDCRCIFVILQILIKSIWKTKKEINYTLEEFVHVTRRIQCKIITTQIPSISSIHVSHPRGSRSASKVCTQKTLPAAWSVLLVYTLRLRGAVRGVVRRTKSNCTLSVTLLLHLAH